MGEQPSTNGLSLQGVTATPGQTAYGVTLLCCFLSAERINSLRLSWKRNSPIQLLKVKIQKETTCAGTVWGRGNDRGNRRGGEASRRRPVREQRAGDTAKAAVTKAAVVDGTGGELTLR